MPDHPRRRQAGRRVHMRTPCRMAAMPGASSEAASGPPRRACTDGRAPRSSPGSRGPRPASKRTPAQAWPGAVGRPRRTGFHPISATSRPDRRDDSPNPRHDRRDPAASRLVQPSGPFAAERAPSRQPRASAPDATRIRCPAGPDDRQSSVAAPRSRQGRRSVNRSFARNGGRTPPRRPGGREDAPGTRRSLRPSGNRPAPRFRPPPPPLAGRGSGPP